MRVRGISIEGHWTLRELSLLRTIVDPLPTAWLEKNPYLQSIIRQDVLRDGPPDAPGHSKYDTERRAIVVYDKGVYHAGSSRIDKEQFRRSVLHELAHTLLLQFPIWLKQWDNETKGDGFVDEYAKTNSHEDFADTFSEFFINPSRTELKAPQKYMFISDRLTRAQKDKVAMVNLDSFADEVFEKVARFGLPRGIMAGAGKMPRGLKLGLVAGGGAGAYTAGKGKGRKMGRAEGTRATAQVAQRAYKIGVQRGATAAFQHMRQRLRRVMGTGSSSKKK